MTRPRVLLADDHTLVSEGLRKLLEPEFELVGTVEDGRALVQAAAKLRPDVILLDISMPVMNGIEAARQVSQMKTGAKIVFLTMHADLTYVGEALRAGGSGYLLKRSAASELAQAIRTVLKGKVYVTPLLAPHETSSLSPFEGAPSGSLGLLTHRQREVLQLVAEGKSSKEIANVLNISVKTVEFHKASIMNRLDLRTTAALTRYAIEHGIARA